MNVNILGVRIDQINHIQAVEKVEEWLSKSGKHYLVTPNIEFIMIAQKDQQFRKILNNADLAVPDSSRFGWVIDQLREKNPFLKILKWPLFLFPQLHSFDVVTGTDLMESLIKVSAEEGFTIGLLGGRDQVAVKLKERLLKKYSKLKVTFADSGGEIDYDGQSLVSVNIPPTDFLFVAFGQVKQEKWIAKNIKKQPAKVMVGVGGAFDYLSDEVIRAPLLVRKLGFEWLFRLILQPWRIKRFINLFKFVLLLAKQG